MAVQMRRKLMKALKLPVVDTWVQRERGSGFRIAMCQLWLGPVNISFILFLTILVLFVAIIIKNGALKA